jgi:hypothetical protein
MLIDGGRESLVATSLLDASNLIVLKVHYDPILITVLFNVAAFTQDP